MASRLFKTLIEEKIEFMKFSMARTSKELFWDEKAQRLFHPGENGTYRESIVKDFLRLVVPGRLEIANGFLINSNNEVSTQCDLIIYDKSNTPLIENGERQRFFPVETVCGIVEIKSTLSKKEFINAINKLAKCKVMREKIGDTIAIKREHVGEFDPKNYKYDHLFSILICHKLNFDITNLCNEVDSMYEDAIKDWQKHNLILSISDGLLAYEYDTKTLMYPFIDNNSLKNRLVRPEKHSNIHIEIAASYIFLCASTASIYMIDITSYLLDFFGIGKTFDQNSYQ